MKVVKLDREQAAMILRAMTFHKIYAEALNDPQSDGQAWETWKKLRDEKLQTIFGMGMEELSKFAGE